jgi:RNA polymerase sigma factor (sigma-70 family)
MEAETVARPARTDDPPPDSFELFYAGTADRVYRALAVTLGDVHLAREATDEAMARAFARWSQVVLHDNPGGWAFRVGLNWATSWRRKLRRERALPQGDGESGACATAGPAQATPPDPAAAAATTALARLPVGQRAVVTCRILLDLSTAETAAALGVAEGTVRSRLSRAMAALRAELEKEDLR